MPKSTFSKTAERPQYVEELLRYGIKVDIDDEDKTIVVSRKEINKDYSLSLSIFACIECIETHHPSWDVIYEEDS